MPENCRIISTARHGTSFWATSGRIDVELENGVIATYFIKVVSRDDGKRMVEGEFAFVTAIWSLLPAFAPKPIGWRSYETVPDTHFFLCEYREMTDELPDIQKYTACLAALHQNSRSPTGKFGFHVTTFNGNLSLNNEWETSWEAFFAKSMKHALAFEVAARGPEPEVDKLSSILFDTIIPRLLRPLESDGRSVKPSLVMEIFDTRTQEPMLRQESHLYLTLAVSMPITNVRFSTPMFSILNHTVFTKFETN